MKNRRKFTTIYKGGYKTIFIIPYTVRETKEVRKDENRDFLEGSKIVKIGRKPPRIS